MNTWIELINGPIWSQMLQMDLLCQKAIESLLSFTLCAIPTLFGVMGLLVVMDSMFLENEDLHKNTLR
jgi:hypothetical protein